MRKACCALEAVGDEGSDETKWCVVVGGWVGLDDDGLYVFFGQLDQARDGDDDHQARI